MADVRRFTTDYVPVEDRIKLSLECSNGTVRVLWLTRPLMNKLAARLVQRVDTMVPADLATDRPLKADVQKRFVQQAAEASLKPQKPVRVGDSAPQAGVAMLVTSIDMREGKKAAILDFKGGDQILHTIPFGHEALRQWLSVLYKCYCAAGWGGEFWPDWIGTPQSQADGVRLN